MNPMLEAKNVKLFLANGHLGGVVTAEIGNWTGHAVHGPRSMLPELLEREELERTGVYFLSGPDPKSGHSSVYIGESEKVGQRLRGHANDDSKDFWERTCLFTSRDQNLTKSHALYLESNLIEIAKKESQATVLNSTVPKRVKLPEPEISDMKYFINHIRLILPILGLEFLRPKPKEPRVDQLSEAQFEIKKPQQGIYAIARETDGEFYVLVGSTAQKEWVGVASENTGYARLHAQLLQQGILQPEKRGNLAKFTEDVPFNSPSAASAVVLGRYDGRRSWAVKGTDMTYAEWQNSQIENS